LNALAIDPSRVLREYALVPLRRQLRATGARVLVLTDARGAEELAATVTRFDAAWVELETLDGIDLPRLGRELSRLLRPGGQLVCVVPGRSLRLLLCRALLGDAGGPPADTPGRASFSAWRRAFEPEVRWGRARAFELLVPRGCEWRRLHPLAIALLAAAEHVVCRWPLLRGLGERVLHEGVRR
jgi:SAM-dependent methyltransferase